MNAMSADSSTAEADPIERCADRLRIAEGQVIALQATLARHTDDLNAVMAQIASASARGAKAGELATACARRLSLETEIRRATTSLVKVREATKQAAAAHELARAREDKRALETRIEAVYSDFDERFASAGKAIVSAAASNARLVIDVERVNRHSDLLRPLPMPDILCSPRFLGRLWIPKFWSQQNDPSHLAAVPLSAIVTLPTPDALVRARLSMDDWDAVRSLIRDTHARLISLYELNAREIKRLLESEWQLRADVHEFNQRWQRRGADLMVVGRKNQQPYYPLMKVTLPLPFSNEWIWAT